MYADSKHKQHSSTEKIHVSINSFISTPAQIWNAVLNEISTHYTTQFIPTFNIVRPRPKSHKIQKMYVYVFLVIWKESHVSFSYCKRTRTRDADHDQGYWRRGETDEMKTHKSPSYTCYDYDNNGEAVLLGERVVQWAVIYNEYVQEYSRLQKQWIATRLSLLRSYAAAINRKSER
jgi:hypothetical protein